ncbi:TetR/AcrR family transcriptional regulator [Trueperella pyogenes]|uniref:TetR/AcrR family transcriptional regulator n=1 Tax=Trueperella pyogenes TaxID=1661 RepID=UPI00345DD689
MNDDLTAKARLREAAIELIAQDEPTTARSVAELAGVSPGLIRHHYGSMKELISACDRHIANLIRQSKEDSVASGTSVDVLQKLHSIGEQHLVSYLAHRLVQGGKEIDSLIDLMAQDAAAYIQQAIDVGIMRPVKDVDVLAKMAIIYSLGSLTLHKHLDRLLHVDVTDSDLTRQPGLPSYINVQYELFGALFTPGILEKLQPRTSQE